MANKNQRTENKKNSNLKLIYSTIKNLSKKGINDLTMNDVSQGAGVRIGNGKVTFDNCNIYKNTADYVRELALPPTSIAPLDAITFPACLRREEACTSMAAR